MSVLGGVCGDPWLLGADGLSDFFLVGWPCPRVSRRCASPATARRGRPSGVIRVQSVERRAGWWRQLVLLSCGGPAFRGPSRWLGWPAQLSVVPMQPQALLRRSVRRRTRVGVWRAAGGLAVLAVLDSGGSGQCPCIRMGLSARSLCAFSSLLACVSGAPVLPGVAQVGVHPGEGCGLSGHAQGTRAWPLLAACTCSLDTNPRQERPKQTAQAPRDADRPSFPEARESVGLGRGSVRESTRSL